ncbi:hypothetical protein CR513_38195, partial [Mucuna pruriens]
MNHGRLRRRYDFKFMTYDSECLSSRILKNAMNKIRNGHDHATWIPLNVQATLDKHWGSTDFQNKSSIAKANRAIDKGVLAYCGGLISTSTHYEKIYLWVYIFIFISKILN